MSQHRRNQPLLRGRASAGQEAGCEIAAASPIRYLTIRVWLAGIECNSMD